MTRVILVAIGMSMLVQSGCVFALSPEVEKLKWLDDAEAKAIFRSDLDSNRPRFFVVNGYAAEVPGVGMLQYERCYNGVELTIIEGTSDALENREHERLNRLARVFAKTYSLLVREDIDRKNGNSCP